MAFRNKNNSLNLFGFVKRFPKDTYKNCPTLCRPCSILGFAAQRNVMSCSRLMKRPQTNEPDYTHFLGKDSAIYLVKVGKAFNRKSFKERHLEIEHAEAQLRKSNKILKEHYLNRRKHWQKTFKGSLQHIQQIPTLSTKLKSIMALNASPKPLETTSFDDLKVCSGMECKRHTIDMKVPQRKSQSHINTSSVIKKNNRAQHPEILMSKSRPSRESVEPDKLLSRNQMTKKNMWQIG